MGGGSLMTPALVFFFDFSVITAVGTDILHGAIFKTVGSVRHRQLGHVMVRLAVLARARLGAGVDRSAST